MDLLFHSDVFLHDTGQHPENAAKLAAFADLPDAGVSATEADLRLVHDAAYIEYVKSACPQSLSLDADTRTSPHSWRAALTAVGLAIKASETGHFALLRPPGHHAYRAQGTGFCLFNNIAIAAQRLVNAGKKVLILDFDGHFGDGTSDIFYTSDRVFFWSLHQYPAFPYKGKHTETGADAGAGFNLNVPLAPGSGDDLLLDALDRFLPAARAFQPDVLAISAGFDAHQADPLLGLEWTTEGYHQIGKRLRGQFPHSFAVLEGGYHPEALTRSVYSFLDGMNGRANRYPASPTKSLPHHWEHHRHICTHLENVFLHA